MKKLALLSLAALLSACATPPSKTTYRGVLPCGDCEKIEAELQLNSDNSYQYNTVYFKRGNAHPFSETGTFARDPQKANVIRLVNSDNLTLKLHDDYVELCDQQGNSIKSKHNYKLNKVK